MPQSEISQIRQQIQAEYDAAKQGLSGLASGNARHDFIQSKTETIGQYHEQLVKLVGPEEAIALIADTIWSPADKGATNYHDAESRPSHMGS
jgi:hypothetical protein